MKQFFNVVIFLNDLLSVFNISLDFSPTIFKILFFYNIFKNIRFFSKFFLGARARHFMCGFDSHQLHRGAFLSQNERRYREHVSRTVSSIAASDRERSQISLVALCDTTNGGGIVAIPTRFCKNRCVARVHRGVCRARDNACRVESNRISRDESNRTSNRIEPFPSPSVLRMRYKLNSVTRPRASEARRRARAAHEKETTRAVPIRIASNRFVSNDETETKRAESRRQVVASPALQVREQREHDHHVLDEGVLVRQAGRGEGGDGVRPLRAQQVHLQDPPEPHVRVHDQLHTQAEAPPREVHDEQRP